MTQLSQSKRETVLDAEGRECKFCEVTEEEYKEEYGKSLDIHHILPRSAGGSNKPHNLIPLCRQCHKRMEDAHGRAMKELAEQQEEDEENPQDKIDSLQESLAEERDMVEKAVDDRSSLGDFFEQSHNLTVHVVHESRFTTSRLLYVGVDAEKAMEKYQDSDKHATMETYKIVDFSLIDALSPSQVGLLWDDANWLVDGLLLDEIEPRYDGDEEDLRL